MIVINEEYEYYMLFVVHCVLFVEAIFCSVKSALKLSFAKSKNKKFIVDFAIMFYCLFYAYLELNFIGSYFDSTPQHFYEFYAMSMQVIFMSLYILRKED